MTLPPIFGVGEYEKGIFKARRWLFGLEKAFFGGKGAENELRPGSGQGVENGVIWVKKSTFRKWAQTEVFEVGEPEKRGFKPF